jgi:hypothetical protein
MSAGRGALRWDGPGECERAARSAACGRQNLRAVLDESRGALALVLCACVRCTSTSPPVRERACCFWLANLCVHLLRGLALLLEFIENDKPRRMAATIRCRRRWLTNSLRFREQLAACACRRDSRERRSAPPVRRPDGSRAAAAPERDSGGAFKRKSRGAIRVAALAAAAGCRRSSGRLFESRLQAAALHSSRPLELLPQPPRSRSVPAQLKSLKTSQHRESAAVATLPTMAGPAHSPREFSHTTQQTCWPRPTQANQNAAP